LKGLSAIRGARHISRGLFNALAELGAIRLAPPRDSGAAAHRLAGALGTIARAHDIAVEVHGEVPRSCALIVANHVSYLDPVAILPICPAIPVAKAEVMSWPIIGPIGAALGTIFVHRKNAYARVHALRRLHDVLASGTSVLNFPEGTTTNGDKVRPLLRGSFGIAQRLGVPVVPMAIRYRDPAMAWCNGATFLPHYLQVAGRDRIEVTLAFGAPMHPRTGEAPEAMAARVRGVIARLLAQGLATPRLGDAVVANMPVLSGERA